MTVNRRNHRVAMITIIITVLVWGAGFVFTNQCKEAGSTASFTNMVRFLTATLLIGSIFHKRIKFTKSLLLFGFLGGAMLFSAFMLQVSALNYTTPANNGFFTASYILFVPFFVWIVNKKAPSLLIILGILCAIIGLFILSYGNFNFDEQLTKPNGWIGDLMTIACAVFFAMQMVLSDKILHSKNVDAINFTFVQIMFAGILFTLYFLIFDLKAMNFATVDWANMAIPLAFVAVLGTAFSYPAQINAQKYLSPSETSLILSMESVVGAVISVLVGSDKFSWAMVIGGMLVTIAVIIVEVLPTALAYRKANAERKWNTPPIDVFPQGEYSEEVLEQNTQQNEDTSNQVVMANNSEKQTITNNNDTQKDTKTTKLIKK